MPPTQTRKARLHERRVKAARQAARDRLTIRAVHERYLAALATYRKARRAGVAAREPDPPFAQAHYVGAIRRELARAVRRRASRSVF
jgi:hypothetical protein